MQSPFDGEPFTHSLALVLANRLVACAVALSLSLVRLVGGCGQGLGLLAPCTAGWAQTPRRARPDPGPTLL